MSAAVALTENGSSGGSGWTDTHCHAHDDVDVDGVLDRASTAGVTRVVCVGTDLASSQKAVTIASRVDRSAPAAWATVGLHPHEATQGVASIAAFLDAYCAQVDKSAHRPGTVVAVGECGLDYHYLHAPRASQRAAFADQIALAKRHELTLVVHTREAWDETLELLSVEGPPQRLVIHCFSGGPDEARHFLDLGAYLSFSGIVTFKGADLVRDAAKMCPLEYLLVETDAPYLSPAPHRGHPNEPGYVPLVGAAIAQLRDVPVDVIAETSAQNAVRAFALEV